MDQQLKNLVYKNNNFELEDIYYQTTNISKNCNHDIKKIKSSNENANTNKNSEKNLFIILKYFIGIKN
jgi:hypothetical protein